jgi:hypothetical protein
MECIDSIVLLFCILVPDVIYITAENRFLW